LISSIAALSRLISLDLTNTRHCCIFIYKCFIKNIIRITDKGAFKYQLIPNVSEGPTLRDPCRVPIIMQDLLDPCPHELGTTREDVVTVIHLLTKHTIHV
jgi:hypothetical protein